MDVSERAAELPNVSSVAPTKIGKRESPGLRNENDRQRKEHTSVSISSDDDQFGISLQGLRTQLLTLSPS